MANNRKITLGRIKTKQVVYSEPQRIFKEKYLSPKGVRLALTATTKKEKEHIWKLYGKNRYISNPNAVPIKTITHR